MYQSSYLRKILKPKQKGMEKYILTKLIDMLKEKERKERKVQV